jgi:hypothetical protein
MRLSGDAEMISCALHKNLDLPKCALPLVPVREKVLYFMKNGSWMHPSRFRYPFMKFVPRRFPLTIPITNIFDHWPVAASPASDFSTSHFLVVEMFQSASRRASYRVPPANRHQSSPPPTPSFFQSVLSRAAIHGSAALPRRSIPDQMQHASSLR